MADDDLYSPAKEYLPALVQVGTVGWASEEEHVFFGTEENTGHTFVCVTLYGEGKLPGSPVTKGVAQGREVLCNLADGVFRVPAKGVRCYVVIPAGMEELQGAGVIVATVTPGNEVRRNVKPGDLFLGASSGEAGIVIKTNGEVAIFTKDDNTPTGKLVAWKLAPTGKTFTAPIGSETFNASGYHLKTKAGPRLDMGGVAIPGLPSNVSDILTAYAEIKAAKLKLSGAIVKLGVGPAFGTALQAPSSGLQPVPGPVPVMTGATYQSSSVWVTTP